MQPVRGIKIEQPLSDLIKRFERVHELYTHLYKGSQDLFHLPKQKKLTKKLTKNEELNNENVSEVDWLKNFELNSQSTSDNLAMAMVMLKTYYQVEAERKECLNGLLCDSILPELFDLLENEASTVLQKLRKLKRKRRFLTRLSSLTMRFSSENSIHDRILAYNDAKIDSFNAVVQFLDHKKERNYNVLLNFLNAVKDYHKSMYQTSEHCVSQVKENFEKAKAKKRISLKTKNSLELSETKRSQFYQVEGNSLGRELGKSKTLFRHASYDWDSRERISFKPDGKVITLFKMTKENDEDLDFEKGEIITIIQQIDDNWFCGYIDDQRIGMFPKTYVRPYYL